MDLLGLGPIGFGLYGLGAQPASAKLPGQKVQRLIPIFHKDEGERGLGLTLLPPWFVTGGPVGRWAGGEACAALAAGVGPFEAQREGNNTGRECYRRR